MTVQAVAVKNLFCSSGRHHTLHLPSMRRNCAECQRAGKHRKAVILFGIFTCSIIWKADHQDAVALYQRE